MRLIDADALMRKFKTTSPMAVDGRARQMVEDMPTIDERKKGEWIVKEGTVCYQDVCSECGKRFVHTYPHYNFCPNCGADMRGEKHETD